MKFTLVFVLLILSLNSISYAGFLGRWFGGRSNRQSASAVAEECGKLLSNVPYDSIWHHNPGGGNRGNLLEVAREIQKILKNNSGLSSSVRLHFLTELIQYSGYIQGISKSEIRSLHFQAVDDGLTLIAKEHIQVEDIQYWFLHASGVEERQIQDSTLYGRKTSSYPSYVFKDAERYLSEIFKLMSENKFRAAMKKWGVTRVRLVLPYERFYDVVLDYKNGREELFVEFGYYGEDGSRIGGGRQVSDEQEIIQEVAKSYFRFAMIKFKTLLGVSDFESMFKFFNYGDLLEMSSNLLFGLGFALDPSSWDEGHYVKFNPAKSYAEKEIAAIRTAKKLGFVIVQSGVYLGKTGEENKSQREYLPQLMTESEYELKTSGKRVNTLTQHEYGSPHQISWSSALEKFLETAGYKYSSELKDWVKQAE